MAAEVDYNMVARATAGYSGAQLMNVMNISGIEATRRGANFITTEDMLNVSHLVGETYTISSAASQVYWHLFSTQILISGL